jgi:tRNA pseudouridine38-40 synthase
VPDPSQPPLFDQAAPAAPPDRVSPPVNPSPAPEVALRVRPERAVVAPVAGWRRVRAVLAYDGAAFHGFAVNPGVPTVAGALTTTLGRILRSEVLVVGAGRTDAGVHARAQVVSFDAPDGTDLERLQRSINSMCAPSIVVRAVGWVGDDFDARFSARWRRYRYLVLNARWPDPLIAERSWHVTTPLDVRSMQLASDPFVGEHDFTSFCRRPKVPAERVTYAPRSMVRRVIDARWDGPDGDGLLRFEITATAFCHQMVRSIVGFLVEVGQGRRHAGEVLTVLRARDRGEAAAVAPPQGLTLWEVGYDDGVETGIRAVEGRAS